MKNLTEKKAIQALVHTAVESYAEGFKARHEAEVDNPEGIINMKVHNVFIEALGKDTNITPRLFVRLIARLAKRIS